MITMNDPLDHIRYPSPRREALRSLLADQVAETTGAPARRRRTRIVVLAGVAVVIAAGASTAVADQLTGSAPVVDQQSARCYTEVVRPSAQDSVPFPGTTIGIPDSSAGPGRVTNALATCADLWRQGILRAGVWQPVMPPASQAQVVPPLVACVLSDGRAAVFPGPAGTCQSFGLPAAKPAG